MSCQSSLLLQTFLFRPHRRYLWQYILFLNTEISIWADNLFRFDCVLPCECRHVVKDHSIGLSLLSWSNEMDSRLFWNCSLVLRSMSTKSHRLTEFPSSFEEYNDQIGRIHRKTTRSICKTPHLRSLQLADGVYAHHIHCLLSWWGVLVFFFLWRTRLQLAALTRSVARPTLTWDIQLLLLLLLLSLLL